MHFSKYIVYTSNTISRVLDKLFMHFMQLHLRHNKRIKYEKLFECFKLNCKGNYYCNYKRSYFLIILVL